MRTNIEIDQELMDAALKLSGLETKKAVIEAALKVFVQLKLQGQIKQWKGKLAWEGDFNKMKLNE